jgi:uroporphyrinogen-III synthase
MQAAPSILSTKPLSEEERNLVNSLGWKLREESFIEIHPHPFGGPISVDHQTILIFTSENGVILLPPMDLSEAAVACLPGKTLVAVCEKFQEDQVVCTAKNAKDLARAIISEGRFTKAIFFCALDHRPELPQILREAGIVLTEVPVYETSGTPVEVDTFFDAVLFFSPSAVDSFFAINTLPPGAVCFAIGETTAGAVRDYTDQRIVISPFPTQKDLLSCVRFYYDNQQCYE